uniref:Uncharacterized protein n=1 Tax=Oryza nivara TaxID=4536 RepID=A0A0E0FU84_ORYNI
MGNIVANYDMDTHTIAMCDMRFDTVQVLSCNAALRLTMDLNDVSINNKAFMITSSISRYVGSVFWR